MSNTFNRGDRVTVNKRPNGSDACIGKEFPFDDVVSAPDGDYTYRLESGWSVYEDMLTFTDDRPDERDDILYILGLRLPDKVKIAAIKSRMEVK